MTTHEAFKKRIRSRMAKTGERYNAARRTLLAGGPPAGAGGWAAQPTVADGRVRQSTGRGWDDWVGVIDAGPGRAAGHTDIATWLRDAHDVDEWWAQTVTVGYERITGTRLPGQMPDGTFSVSRSRAVDLDPDDVRAALLDDGDRAALLPGLAGVLRSRATAKTLRFDAADAATGAEVGVVAFSLESSGGRVRFTVTHERLPTAAAAEVWKSYWTDWLDALAADSQHDGT